MTEKLLEGFCSCDWDTVLTYLESGLIEGCQNHFRSSTGIGRRPGDYAPSLFNHKLHALGRREAAPAMAVLCGRGADNGSVKKWGGMAPSSP